MAAAKILTAGLLVLLAGCALNPATSAGIPCSVGPGTPGADDVLSDDFARWVVVVDTSGRKICGWKRRGEK